MRHAASRQRAFLQNVNPLSTLGQNKSLQACNLFRIEVIFQSDTVTFDALPCITRRIPVPGRESALDIAEYLRSVGA